MVSELGFREFAINKLRSKGLITDFWSAIHKNETICYFWGNFLQALSAKRITVLGVVQDAALRQIVLFGRIDEHHAAALDGVDDGAGE